MLDPEIERHLARFPPADVDFSRVEEVRARAAQYMAESGGAAPLYADPRVRLDRAEVAGVPVWVWSPANASGARPAVVAFHGGGFIVGGPLGAERVAFPLARDHGIVTVSVAYRLAPEHRAPAQLDDGFAVLTHLRAQSRVENILIDPARLALHGSSAGGCIAAGLAQRARDEGIDLALQSLNAPVLDDRAVYSATPNHSMLGPSPTWSRRDTQAAWHHYLGDAAPPPAYAVPARTHDLVGLCPAHICVAEYDVLRDEALDYARRLWEAGVPVTVHRSAGTVHGFDGLMPDSAVAARALAHQVSLLASALG